MKVLLYLFTGHTGGRKFISDPPKKRGRIPKAREKRSEKTLRNRYTNKSLKKLISRTNLEEKGTQKQLGT